MPLNNAREVGASVAGRFVRVLVFAVTGFPYDAR
jgi:hypothetical protein